MNKAGDSATIFLFVLLSMLFVGGVYLGYTLETSTGITSSAVVSSDDATPGICSGDMFGFCSSTGALALIFLVLLAVLVAKR